MTSHAIEGRQGPPVHSSGKARLVRAGFIPLIDAAPLIVAERLGFAEKEGLTLILSRETSWATLRDRIAVGHLDVAHMLAPMPIAAQLGLTPLPCRVMAPMAMGGGGNTIAVSKELWRAFEAEGAATDFDARGIGDVWARVTEKRRKANERPLVIAVVHLHSAHRYQLIYWLEACGVDPVRDVEFVVVPPFLMPAALGSGKIDAFTAGEPWGSVAAEQGVGVIVTTNIHIWRGVPEKVLGVHEGWAEAAPDVLAALVRAVYAAARWCNVQENRGDLADLLSDSRIINVSNVILRRSLVEGLAGPDGRLQRVDGFLSFAGDRDLLPDPTHALLFLAQFARCGDVQISADHIAKAAAAYRPDLFEMAMEKSGVQKHTDSVTLLGAETFFDERVFDPAGLLDRSLGYKPAFG